MIAGTPAVAQCPNQRIITRDAPGKEREKPGTGKTLERTLFFPFPFLHFLTTFFPLSGENRQKWVKKGVERQKKGWRDVERQRTAIPRRSKLSNMAIFRFLYRLKPVFPPIPTPFLPLSTPVLVFFLYCLAIISRCAPVAAQPLDHVGSPPVRRPMGGLYSWRGGARDEFARYVCSHTWEQAERLC